MSRSEDDLMPARPWHELIQVSRHRGTSLRRRRRALLAAPPLVTVLLLAALPWVLDGGRSSDALLQDVAGYPTQAPTEPVPVAPLDATPTPAGGGVEVAPPGDAGASAPRQPGGAAARPRASAPAPVRPRATPAPRGKPQTVPRPVEVRFSDVAGDAREQPAGGPVSTSSDDNLDIIEMRFTAQATGVLVEMVLLGKPTNDYSATLSDPQTRCSLRVTFGVGTQPEGAQGFCGATATTDFTGLPEVEDPQPDILRAFVPYEQFPADVDPARPLGLSGDTYYDSPPTPRGGTTAGEMPVDTAHTDRTLSRPRA